MKTTTLFRTLLLALLMAAAGNGAMAQDIDLRLRTFLNYYPIQCDSIVVQNTTQGTSATLYYPDTTLSNHTVGIDEFAGANRVLRMGILTDNPYQDRVEVFLNLPQTETVEFCLFNELGQLELVKTEKLVAGQHRLDIKTGANGLHILSARTPSDQCSVKLMQQGGTHGKADMVIGDELQNIPTEKGTVTARSTFDFSVGDHLTMTSHANAHYYDTVIPIHQTVGFTVSESGTVNFNAFQTFEDSLYKDSIDIRNTRWDVVATLMFNHYECLADFATDMGEEVESQVTFYDSTFCSVRRAGSCDASYYNGYPIQNAWIYNHYSSFCGKYRVEYELYPEDNVVVTNLYVGSMDSLCSNLTYHYKINYWYDYNIMFVTDETRGMDATWTYYGCYFRKEGWVE